VRSKTLLFTTLSTSIHFLSFKRSKQGTLTQLRAGRHRTAPRRCAPRLPRSPGRSRLPEAALSRGGEHSEALKSAPTPRGGHSLAGRPHSAIPCGPSWCSPVRARRPMPLAVPRVKVGCSFAVQARPHPLSLKPDCATHSAPPALLPLAVPSVGASQGCRGEPSFPRPPFPTIVPSTTSHTYDSSPACSLLPLSRRLAGAELPATAARLCRGVASPVPSTPNQAHKPSAGESLVVPPTFLGQPCRRSRRISAGTAAPMA
jgi:hypothetical protein